VTEDDERERINIERVYRGKRIRRKEKNK